MLLRRFASMGDCRLEGVACHISQIPHRQYFHLLGLPQKYPLYDLAKHLSKYDEYDSENENECVFVFPNWICHFFPLLMLFLHLKM